MKKFLLSLIFILFLCSNNQALASSISMYGTKEVNIDDSFKVLISIDSDEIPVNSIDVVVEFNNNLVTFVGFKDNDTLFKTWIQSPTVDGNKIYFTGIIPGGVGGVYDINKKDLKEIPVVNLIFKANKKGNAEFIFNKSDILQNDGLGTAIYPTQNKLNISIKDSLPIDKTIVPDQFLITDNDLDINPPLPFVISFISASSISETKDMIIFNTNDLESAIKEYRIKKGADWILVESPFVVSKNIFSQSLVIRAYDFHNNFTESSINIKGYIDFSTMLYILILVILSSILFRKLLK